MRIEPPSNDPKIKSGSVKGKKNVKRDKISASEKAFESVLFDAEYESFRKTVEELVQEVVEAGNDFVRSPTPEYLFKYKKKVRNVLAYVQKNLYKIAGKYDFNLNQPRLHIIAEQIDERLEELSKLLMSAEKETMKIADRVGEINGLLFDIYK